MTKYTLSSPDKPLIGKVGQVTMIEVDETGVVTAADKRIAFLIGWGLPAVKRWVKYKKWSIRQNE